MSHSLANFVHELHFSSTARRPSLPKCPNSPHFRPRACDVAEFWVVTPSFSLQSQSRDSGEISSPSFSQEHVDLDNAGIACASS